MNRFSIILSPTTPVLVQVTIQRVPEPTGPVLATVAISQKKYYGFFGHTDFKVCAVIVFTHDVRMGGWAVGQREKVCLSCM